MEKVAVVARSFQPGTGEGGKKFDTELFGRIVARPISRLLKAEVVRDIIVVVNGELGNEHAEFQNSQGVTPTMTALKDYFPEEILSGKIITKLCLNWGPNPGSAIALNEGLGIAQRLENLKWLMNWSPEIEMDGRRIELGLAHAERYNLSVVGFLRQGWWEKPQWHVVQNTSALWDINELATVQGFNRECNGTGQMVKTLEYGDQPLAGMEDFHALLRIMKQSPNLRWGMVGKAEPLFWDTDFPAGPRLDNHLKKVARQDQVMQKWAGDIFPELTFKKVMDRLFTSCYFD